MYLHSDDIELFRDVISLTTEKLGTRYQIVFEEE
jgi:hypothetical protein